MGGAWHHGRAWVGHEIEDSCPCPQEACGLVSTPDPACDQHALIAAKSIRQSHRAEDCPMALDGKIITDPDPKWFTTQLTEGGHTYPFFDTEDGDIFGLGHQDPEEFASEAAAYWREVGLDDEDFGAGEIPSRVEHRWYVVEETDPEKTDYTFYIHAWLPMGASFGQERTPVTAETPGAVAITTVQS